MSYCNLAVQELTARRPRGVQRFVMAPTVMPGYHFH
jgi:hypothetical protein